MPKGAEFQALAGPARHAVFMAGIAGARASRHSYILCPTSMCVLPISHCDATQVAEHDMFVLVPDMPWRL